MKIGDIVVYTPPGHAPVTDEFTRFIVVGVVPESGTDNELIWISNIYDREDAHAEPVTCEEAADFTVVELQ